MKVLLVSLRPHQWTKNLLVFAALCFTKHLFDPEPLMQAVAAFAVFCALSGVVYLINDIADMDHDRRHPRKRLRPIASGALAIPAARSAAAVLGALSLTGAALLSWAFLAVATAYLTLNLVYSLRLKEIVILDVLSVSLGFVLRAIAGSVAIGAPISDWLLVCTILLALFLALAKRRHEITSLGGEAPGHRPILREYSPYLLDQMISVVTASCVTAYAFYTLVPETQAKFETHRLSWTIPFVLYGIFRYLYLVHRKDGGGSPSESLVTDRPLLVAVALWAVATVAILYTAGGAPVPLQAGP